MNIIKATTDQQKQDAYAVRHDVFVIEQEVDASIERDELDKVATHMLSAMLTTSRLPVFGLLRHNTKEKSSAWPF